MSEEDRQEKKDTTQEETQEETKDEPVQEESIDSVKDSENTEQTNIQQPVVEEKKEQKEKATHNIKHPSSHHAQKHASSGHHKKKEHQDKNDYSGDEEPEDDLKIDFSGIKKFFSKGHDGHDQKKQKRHHARDEEEDDDSEEESLNLDFSAIKKFFSKGAIDNRILIALFILIPVILTIFIRLQPADLPATDSWAQNSVMNYYRNVIGEQVNAQYPNLPQQNKDTLINQQLDQFANANKAQIDQQIKETSAYFKTGFRYEENGKTWTFLGDLDSYFWLRQARNLESKGMVCDEIRDGECYDNHMMAPLGTTMATSMHSYGIVALYKVLKIFDKSVTLMRASFLLPTVLAVIAVIAAFFAGRRLMNEVAGFFAAMLVSLNPLVISRTLGSDTDIWNVMFSLIIMALFLEAMESKKLWTKITYTILGGIACGLFSFAWDGGWWYIFDFIIIATIGYIIFEIIKESIKKKGMKDVFTKDVKSTALILAIFFVSTVLFVSLFSSFATFKNTYVAPIGLLSTLKVATHATLWPNVYTTVAELNEAGIDAVIGQISLGHKILAFLGLLGIIFTMVNRKPTFKEYLIIGLSTIIYLYAVSASAMQLSIILYLLILSIPVIAMLIIRLIDHQHTVDIKPALILTVWLIGMIYASTKGVRFILLLVPAFSISLGVAIGFIFQYLERVAKDQLNFNALISRIGLFIILCLILIMPLQIGIASGQQYVPSITKGWWDTLTKIRDESKPDAIINSWWDFGHWFKYVADRRVTLDGASQNHPNAHWLGKLMQTNNENETIGILRMLDCGSNNAFEEINKKNNDAEISENTVNEIILLGREDAQKKLLEYGYTADAVDTILKYSHCDPPENYFITSEDMVGKSGVWAHFGLWNFDRAYVIANLRDKTLKEATDEMIKRWNYTQDQASKIYFEVQGLQTDREMNDWISPWPGYATGLIGCGSKDELVGCSLNIIVGNNNNNRIVVERIVVNMTDPTMSQSIIGVYDPTNRRIQETVGNFQEIVILDNTTKKYRAYNSTIGLSILINVIREGNETIYQGIVADPNLIDSTFTKLFFLEGHGMKHFEKFSDVTDITGQRIIVWKVKW
jgi:asparagine N-glycosylation enzyme membrane subunit Stt3